jgi:hypothetical protein
MMLAPIANVIFDAFEIPRSEADHAISALPFEQLSTLAEEEGGQVRFVCALARNLTSPPDPLSS